MKNIKSKFLFLSFGIVLGIVLALTFQKQADRPFGEVPDSAAATSIDYAEQVQAMEVSFAQKQDSLQNTSDSLASALGESKSQLKSVKARSHQLQEQIYEILDTRFEKQLADSTTAPSPCDSLIESVSAYLDETQLKDSLQLEVQKGLEGQLAVKDSQLLLKRSEYDRLRDAFDSTQLQATALKEANVSLTCQFKKQRTKSRVLGAVLVFVTGAAATYLLHH
ncbi:hypothetical protein [Flaviaesturariibacter aridisoli]|uniref:Uncharacterized protein n=1 Tax=Flaviaesturariibacter aridisoli TaxID=2545761 RepID=A0A4R4DZZ8_9BACT|nr:hypothetical protein [Flaviaesturariibacter aridisoli]TCZ68347.1 hypothetical protein E0486_14240 [Flaviaesturariibacter aridisoli]